MLDNKVTTPGTLLILNGKIYIDGWELEKPGMCREHAIFACMHSAGLLLKAATEDIAAPGGAANSYADMPNETPREWLCKDAQAFLDMCDELRPRTDASKPSEASGNQYLPISVVISLLAHAINTAICYRSKLVTINDEVAVSAVRRIEELQAEVEKVRLSADDAHLSRIAAEEERELLRKDRDAIKSCEQSMQRWKLMAEYQYARRVYPNELALGHGALDATMEKWTGDAYRAAIDAYCMPSAPTEGSQS